MSQSQLLDITAIILTKDEELHIERCIRSVRRVCRQVLVVDSYSTDRTCEIAESLGAIVVQHPFENQARQFNWAIDNVPIETEWIWRVDADEIIEDKLVTLVQETLPTLSDHKEVNGIYVNKKIVFMGRPLLNGGWYPAQQIKIVRRGYGRSEDKQMDEHLVITSGETISLDGDQTDWNLKPLDWWWNKHVGYARREAAMQVEQARIGNGSTTEVEGKLFGTNAEFKRWMKNLYSHCPRYLRVVVYFVSRYFFMLGFLDGYAGWYWHTRQGLMYRWMVDREIGKMK
ncbi:MAG: glycosyltransferase family 2 protein, partial [Bacteroidales bacterium]|nr:glycosyltransferase family 2 protein [Bacteroidales bacterium]